MAYFFGERQGPASRPGPPDVPYPPPPMPCNLNPLSYTLLHEHLTGSYTSNPTHQTLNPNLQTINPNPTPANEAAALAPPRDLARPYIPCCARVCRLPCYAQVSYVARHGILDRIAGNAGMLATEVRSLPCFPLHSGGLHRIQGYLAHNKQPSSRSLQQGMPRAL